MGKKSGRSYLLAMIFDITEAGWLSMSIKSSYLPSVQCNDIKIKIFFSGCNVAIQPKQHNLNSLGIKTMMSASEKLQAAKLLKVTKGIPRYSNVEDPKKSSFEALLSFVELCQSLIKVPTQSSMGFFKLRIMGDTHMEYQPTPHTDNICTLMKKYSDFLKTLIYLLMHNQGKVF